MTRYNTLDEILPAAAREDRQITFIEGENQQRVLSFRRLRQRAIGVLGALQRRGLVAGDKAAALRRRQRALVELFWACVLGGIVPVPLAPGGTPEHLRKLWAVFAQLERAWVCIDATSLERFEAFAASEGAAIDAARLRARALVAGALEVDGAARRAASGRARSPRLHPVLLGLDRRSQGRAADAPQPVREHRLDHRGGRVFRSRRALSWMPLSHDMGLIGFHLNMLAAGASHAIMRTELFARRPLLWLELASRMGATVLCSPNFGYQHYLKQYELKPRPQLDLSGGAPDLQRRRADLGRSLPPLHAGRWRRTASGRTAMFTVYGLAEASLAVSFPRLGAPLATLHLERAGLRVGEPVRIAESPADPLGEFVKLGGRARHRDPDRRRRGTACADGCWPHRDPGENVTAGYYVARGAGGDEARGRLARHRRPRPPERRPAGGDGPRQGPGHRQRPELLSPRLRAGGAAGGRRRGQPVAAAGVRLADEQGEGLAMFVLHRGELEGFVAKAAASAGPSPSRPGSRSRRSFRWRRSRRRPAASCSATCSPGPSRRASSRRSWHGSHRCWDRPTPGGRPVEPASTLGRLQAICQRVVPDRQIGPDGQPAGNNLNSLTWPVCTRP
jgi:hypothetical protein